MDTPTTHIVTKGGRRWLVGPAAEVLLAEGWPLDRPDRLALVKRSRGRTICRLEAGGRGFFVKRFDAGGPWRRLRARLGAGPGRREWQRLWLARAAGVPVPEPVALALGPPETLVTAEVPGAERLDAYLFARYYPPGPDDPPYPGARPSELVAAYRRRRAPPPGTLPPRRLARLLAEVVARLHEADLFLPDLHPGNLLVAGAGETARLVVVDLAEAARPAPPEALLQHLVRLEHFFEPIATAAERLRCLAALRDRLGPAAPDARTVTRATAVYRRRFYLARDRRTRRRSKYFRPVRIGSWRGWATTDWAEAVEALARAGLLEDRARDADEDQEPAAGPTSLGPSAVPRKAAEAADRAGDRPGTGEPAASGAPPPAPSAGGDLKRSPSSAVWALAAPDGRRLVVKADRRADRRLGGRLGRTRALAAFRRGHALLVRGVPTARPAAALRRRGPGGRLDALLLTEEVPGARPLQEFLRSDPPPAVRRCLAWALGRLLRRMHEAGFAHRDLKAPNILVRSAGPEEEAEAAPPAGAPDAAAPAPGGPAATARPRPVLVDLDGLRPVGRVSARRRARDLARLAVSLEEWGLARRTDRLRLLKAYLATAGGLGAVTVSRRGRGRTEPGRRLRRWWRAIERAARRKRAALRRRYGRVERL